ncbi:MAG: hypothetical protein HGA37_06375 [Lentimicrobium sp.]|nr:hypothetical protein [Lentimicrobium sp.]
MKTLKVVITGLAIIISYGLQAQVSVNVNIGSPPQWGPAGYSDVQYYYLPDVYSYYDVRSSMFIYQSNGVWIRRAYLPPRYRNYDLYGGYKVVMRDYHGNTPYVHYRDHKHKYAKGYRGPAQRNIGTKPGNAHHEGNSQFRDHSYKASSYKNGNNSGQGNKSKSNNGKSHSKGKGNKK